MNKDKKFVLGLFMYLTTQGIIISFIHSYIIVIPLISIVGILFIIFCIKMALLEK
jgi:hypothetical protein